MRIGITPKKLTMAALGLGMAALLAAVPAGPVPGSGEAAFGAPVAVAAPADRQDRDGVDDARDVDRRDGGGGGGQGQQQPRDNGGDNIDPITGDKVKETSVIQYINAAYVWLAFIGGLLAVISLIYAGYSYMGSYGDPEKIANAKDIVEKTLIGLSLLILAALILNSINPRTVSEPCRKDAPGCGDIDFTKPGG